MKLVIASDHAGLELKEEVRAYLTKSSHEVLDLGAFRIEPQDDYPDFAERVGLAIKGGDAPRGILICGSGVGVCIAAMSASMSATSMDTATRVGFCGSMNVRMLVTPNGPKNSSRFGEASQCF